MKRLFAGAITFVVIITASVVVWYQLNDQARGIVVGVLLGAGGFAAGVLLALSVVAIFLLINLRWSVTPQSKPPIVLPGTQPALPAPPQQQWHRPPQYRNPRRWWDIVGAEDVEDVESEMR